MVDCGDASDVVEVHCDFVAFGSISTSGAGVRWIIM